MSEVKKIKTIVVDTINQIQNNQYMSLLDRGTMVSRDKWKDFGVELYTFLVEGLQSRGFEVVLILGSEGSGKSFGIKYLEPGTNIWYNADRKNPTFLNVEYGDKTYPAREVYGRKNAPSKYMVLPQSYKDILAHLDQVIQSSALDDNRMAFIIGHMEEYKATDGEIRTRLKTLGNLATKMNIEGSVENLLYSRVFVEGDKAEYRLETQNNGFNAARTTEGAFSERFIPNNFDYIYNSLMQ